MQKRTWFCIPIVLMLMAGLCLAQDNTPNQTNLEEEIDELPLDMYRSLSFEPEDTGSDFIRKGSRTGKDYKLMDINVFLGTRYTAINNNSNGMNSDVDGFSVPIAYVLLQGQAYQGIYYKVGLQFADYQDAWLTNYPPYNSDDYLYDALLTWKPDMEECPALNSFAVSAGITSTFLSPAAQLDSWEQEFIEYPLIVYAMLPPGINRDVGAYIYADALSEGRLKFWLGLWNGAHRTIQVTGANAVTAVDAWGGGTDNDQLALMARAQVDVLEEDDYLLSFSGGLSRNKVDYNENGANHNGRTDTIYNAASELRFNERNTWAKGEFMHAYLKDSNAPTQEGYYLAVGHLLDPIVENLEIVGRFDRVEVNDHITDGNDMRYFTAGLNYYFDPTHKNDAKVQVNYVIRKEGRGATKVKNNALMFQFVIGF